MGLLDLPSPAAMSIRISLSLKNIDAELASVDPALCVIARRSGNDVRCCSGAELLEQAREWQFDPPKAVGTLAAAMLALLSDEGGNGVELVIIRAGVPHFVDFGD